MAARDVNLDFAKRNFAYFCKHILGLDVAPFHYEIIENVLTHKLQVVIAPRGHGKSELFAVSYPLWLVFRARKRISILIVSSTLKQASSILDRIKTYCEDIPLLKATLQPKNKHSAKWNNSEIVMSNKCMIASTPLASSIRGWHVDFCICDDILRDDIGTTAKTKKMFYEIVRPIVETKNGKMLVIGTPQSYIDLLADLSDKSISPEWASLRYTAVITDGAGKWVKPLWGGRFDLEKLKKVKLDLGSVAWAKEYMTNPISSGSSLYPWDLVKECITAGLEQHEVGRKSSTYFLGADIAVSSKDSADRTVFVVGEGNQNKLTIRKVEIHEGWSTDRIFARLVELQNNFQFRHALVEQVGVSYSLAEELSKHPACRTSFEGFITSRVKKEHILSGLEVIMRNKSLEMPKNETLIDELLSFGIKLHSTGRQTYEALGKHDDTVMALALMVESSKNSGGKVSAAII